jgi:histidinol-phosphate aminotransferase
MTRARRDLLGAIGLGAFGPRSSILIAARGREAREAEYASGAQPPPEDADAIRIDSNENPLGPGLHAVEALMAGFDDAGRYPTNARPSMMELRDTIAQKRGVKSEHVILGAGSGEILRNAVRAYTSATRPLVTASPSFESPERMAEKIGSPVRRVPVDSAGRIDIEGMAAAAKGAGLVFFCYPNNPTATVCGSKTVADFVARVRRESPDTAILIDEAYHDYVTDPSYATAIPVAMAEPGVFVTRTFSKAYGMAGLRIGYAVGQPATMTTLGHWTLTFNQNAPGVAAAMAALANPDYIAKEGARNSEVRDFTMKFFRAAGFKPTDSQGNFVFVDIGRPAAEFRTACRQQQVMVGRPFPPLDKTWARISLGTSDEMKRATEVFKKVLGVVATAAAR